MSCWSTAPAAGAHPSRGTHCGVSGPTGSLAELFELGVQLLPRRRGQHGPLGTPLQVGAEVQVPVIEQRTQGDVEVVEDTTAAVDEQVVADEDDVAPADPAQREQPA